MESTKGIEKNIEILRNEIKYNDLKISELKKTTAIPGAFKEVVEYRNAHKEELENARRGIESLSNENDIINIKIKLLKNNYKIAMFNEIMPVALEVFNKWKNKPYGEKTREKIKFEILEKTGSIVYINDRNEFHCFKSMEYDKCFECGAKYIDGTRRSILLDNKIQELSMENLELYYIRKEYIEDIETEVKTILELHNKAMELKNELDRVCREFNNHAVDGMNYKSIVANGFYL